MSRVVRSAIALVAVSVAVSIVPSLASADDAADRHLAIADFKRSHKRVGVLTQNGLVTNIHGRSFSLGATPRDSAETFLVRNAKLFGLQRAALQETTSRSIMNGTLTSITYEQRWNGLKVDASRVSLLIRNEQGNPLVLATAATFVIPDDLPAPTLSARNAFQKATDDDPAMASFHDAELVVHPRGAQPKIAWFFWADSPIGPNFQRWGYYVDAVSGDILERRNGIVHANITGQVTGLATPGVLPNEENNPAIELPIEGVRVFVNGGGETYVQPDGSFVLPNEGDDEVLVRLDLQGRWCLVQNVAGVNISDVVSAIPPGPADFFMNAADAPFDTAQLNAIIHTTRVHDFIKSIVPDFDEIDQQLPANVNITDECNASYSFGTPGFMRFFRVQPGDQPHCPNTAYSGVVYHEYGHFVIHQALGFTAAGDYHEGIADSISALLANDFCVAPGFFGIDQGCLRDIDEPDFVYPVGSPSPHTSGLAIGGAMWDMRTELVDRLGEIQGLEVARELLLNQIIVGPGVIGPQITITLLTLDDDDDDIFNGTPNYLAIHRGFSRHGMPGPELALLEFDYPAGLPFAVSPLSGVIIPITITDGPAGTTLESEAVSLFVSTDNGDSYDQVLLAIDDSTPDGAQYQAHLPAADCFGTIQWYIQAITQSGEDVLDPPTAPAQTYTANVATSSQVLMDDNFEQDLGWTVARESVDDPFEPGLQDLTTGDWARVDPVPVINPEDDDAVTQPGSGAPGSVGSFAYVTGPDDGESPGSDDVDWGPVSLISPIIAVAGGDARLSYSRWFYNDDGDDDALTIELSNDNGESWTLVETLSQSTEWVAVSHSVSDFLELTDQMVVRFSAADIPNDSITEAAIDEFRIVAQFCASADIDGDLDVDLVDFAGLQRCYTGDGSGPVSQTCRAYDFDVDDDVDLTDFDHFLNTVTGPQPTTP
jgi:hypothetical protein